jgi:hypothetical protein
VPSCASGCAPYIVRQKELPLERRATLQPPVNVNRTAFRSDSALFDVLRHLLERSFCGVSAQSLNGRPLNR